MIFILLNNLSVTSQTTFPLIASIHLKVCITFREFCSLIFGSESGSLTRLYVAF